jgi:hypothetical protein
MKTTEIELRTEEGKSFLEANQAVLEQCAVQALMELMNSPQSPEVKLAAANSALRALGKSEPKAAPPSTTTNIQINTAVAGELGKALAGLAGVARLLPPAQPGNNAPQIAPESANG